MTRRVAILGAGQIGAGWAARFSLMGWDVAVFDPDAATQARLDGVLARARLALPGLWDVPMPPEGEARLAPSIAAALTGAEWVIEAAPERLELKRKLFQKAQEFTDAPIASSSAGFTLEALRGCAPKPERIIALRPAAPVYLMPMVSLDAAADPGAQDMLASLGMAPGTGNPAPGDDVALVAQLRALKWANAGVGVHLRAMDATRPLPPPALDAPILTAAHAVPLDWIDYNGHMTEARYLQAFADASDRFMEIIGCDGDYIASGGSFFTAETHIRHLHEVLAGTQIRVETLCLGAEGKKMHLFHSLFAGETRLATGEHMLIHVSLHSRRPAPPAPHIADRLARISAAHAALPRPEGVGRAIGQPRPVAI